MNGVSGWLQRRWYSLYPVWLLIPLTWMFVPLAALRREAYRLGLFKSASLPAPVLVAGNITVGGTGKTPFVLWLAQVLTQRGYHPGIITRGYGGKRGGRPQLVSGDGDPFEMGDEAVLLARRSGVPVAAGADRVAAARLLLDSFPVDVIISDDGLQHYRLRRQLEIVLLDAERGLGNGWRLPAGPLRESRRRLHDVDLVVLKQSDGAKFAWPEAVDMRLSAGEAVNLASGARQPLPQFAGRTVHALAGIGHPEQFFRMLRDAGLRVISHPMPDHAKLLVADVQFGDALPVFMTEKDAVKCRHMELPELWCVPATAQFAAADEARILDLIQAALGGVGRR
jgi:tetraacyldisaccharide 4'-kinase